MGNVHIRKPLRIEAYRPAQAGEEAVPSTEKVTTGLGSVPAVRRSPRAASTQARAAWISGWAVSALLSASSSVKAGRTADGALGT